MTDMEILARIAREEMEAAGDKDFDARLRQLALDASAYRRNFYPTLDEDDRMKFIDDFSKLISLAEAGLISKDVVNEFWGANALPDEEDYYADNANSIDLVGSCSYCHSRVSAQMVVCSRCGAPLGV